MRYQVVLSDKAEADVATVLQWFRDHEASEAGRRWFNQLMDLVDTLEQQPDRCSLAAESDDLGQEIRELFLGRRRYKYRILFRVSGKTVQILRVWHGSRDSVTREEL